MFPEALQTPFHPQLSSRFPSKKSPMKQRHSFSGALQLTPPPMASLHGTTPTPSSSPLPRPPFPRRSRLRLSLSLPSLAPLSSRTLPRAHQHHRHRVPTRRDPNPLLPTDNGTGERPVQCEVDVVSWRERRIHARVSVYADVDDVWRILTDYERLADFIPNLVYSGRVECPYEGRVWLEQIGVQRALYWLIEARVVLDLHETWKSANERELHFSMVDGDFKKFEGKWSVKDVRRSSTTTLSYEVSVIPRFNFPAMFVERIIRSDLPVNLRALACRAEGSATGVQYQPASVNGTNASSQPLDTDVTASVSLKNKLTLDSAEGNQIGSELGVLPTPSSLKSRSNWGVFGKFCSLDKPCMVDEVHLRRFDGPLENGGVHRCVVASITVKAPSSKVWNVLTSYEKLPEIVPNLAISKVLLRENSKVRILQEGCRGLLYMVLHARVILDLNEKHEQEISFEQVEGDFESLHGKWILEQLGDRHTLLKYIIESKLHKDTFLFEAIVEEVIYEDLPSNLCAIRDYVEREQSANLENPDPHPDPSLSTQIIPTEREAQLREEWPSEVDSCSTSSLKHRPKVPGLQRDIDILKSELLSFISEHGQEGFMPMRKQLRLHRRVDIEKAITRMGGFRKIANLMNLSLAYKDKKPKGYWDNLENLQKEISKFQRNWEMDPTYMPSRKSFERAGRYDIARALERWGGVQEVSRLLSLELRYPRKQLDSAGEKDNKAGHPINSRNSHVKGKPYVSQFTDKWILKLKDPDLNWLE